MCIPYVVIKNHSNIGRDMSRDIDLLIRDDTPLDLGLCLVPGKFDQPYSARHPQLKLICILFMVHLFPLQQSTIISIPAWP